MMLVLKFKDENGEEQRVEVDRDIFTIGRHSLCDLTFLDGRLSREHARIERENGTYRITDLGSSNGTKLNHAPVTSYLDLRDGDTIDLGGGLEIAVELSAAPSSASPSVDTGGPDVPGTPLPGPVDAGAAPPGMDSGYTAQTQPSPAKPEGFPVAFFIIAPLLGLFVIIAVVAAIVLFGGGGAGDPPSYEDEPGYGRSSQDDPRDDDDTDPTPSGRSSTPVNSRVESNSRTQGPSPSPSDPGPGGGNLSETAKVEKYAPPFLREIAQNDPRAFLTGEQAAKVNDRIKQLKGSPGLADNIASARKNSSALKSLASSKNLKPQFLAIAAITRLGGGRGDVLQAAQNVADVYGKLSIQIGTEDFDAALLMVAAFEQGANGDTMKMRNLLQEVADAKGAPPPRTVRTIWYLDKIGKISRTDLDRALTFLAIGVISQNPKEFGVNAEALAL